MKNRFTLSAFLIAPAIIGSSNAALVVNGDFSSAIGPLGWIERTNADGGWYHSGWTISSSAANAASTSIGQVNTIGSETGNLITLSFDWTPDAGATGNALRLYYSAAGWFDDGSATGSDDFMNLNGGNVDANGNSTYSGLTGNASVLDLQTGITYVNTNHTNTVVTESFITGTPGVTQSFQVQLDMSGFAANVDDISDLKYFGFRFHGDETISGTNLLDNVAASASTIPEPSSLALAALGLVSLMGRRRR